MSMVIGRTVTASDLRDPEVLAEAGRTPIGVYDSRRQETLVLTSRAAFENDQRLHDYMGLLAHAVVELSRDDPSPVALGEAGYVAAWLPTDRAWWLRGLAESVAESVSIGSVEPVAGFVRWAQGAGSSLDSPLEQPIDASRFASTTSMKLRSRSR